MEPSWTQETHNIGLNNPYRDPNLKSLELEKSTFIEIEGEANDRFPNHLQTYCTKRSSQSESKGPRSVRRKGFTVKHGLNDSMMNSEIGSDHQLNPLNVHSKRRSLIQSDKLFDTCEKSNYIERGNLQIRRKVQTMKMMQSQLFKLQTSEDLLKQAGSRLNHLDSLIREGSKTSDCERDTETDDPNCHSNRTTSRKIRNLVFNRGQSTKCNVYLHAGLYQDINYGGFKTNPAAQILCSFSIQKLMYVSEFSIENEFGKIEFLEPVDLTGVDLLKTVRISEGRIEVYPNEYFEQARGKPKRFRKLNQPARLIFKQVNPPRDFSDFPSFLQRKCAQIGAVFERFDGQRNQLVVIIPGF